MVIEFLEREKLKDEEPFDENGTEPCEFEQPFVKYNKPIRLYQRTLTKKTTKT